MEMSNEMRELKAKLKISLEAVEDAVKNGDVDAATKNREDVDKYQKLYAIAEKTFEDRKKAEKDTDTGVGGESVYNKELFYKAISSRDDLTESEIEVINEAKKRFMNSYSEGSKKDGGYTVPDDLATELFKSIKDGESVRNLVGVENVKSLTGTRIFRNGQSNKLYNTEEAAEIREMNNAEYSPVTYKQHKYAGLMSVSNELLEDSFANFSQEITEWLSGAARLTENHEILYGAGGDKHPCGLISTAGAFNEVTVPQTLTIDFFRAITLALPSGYRPNAKWTMNSLAFKAVSELKDETGRSYIQPDPREKDTFMLCGYQINVYDMIETDESNKTVIMFGDATKAYRMFARKDFGIAFTDVGAGAFETDSLKAKGVERFDGKPFDREALILVRDFAVTALTITEKDATVNTDINEETLSNLKKVDLLELVDEYDVPGVTSESTKAQIIEAILEKLYPTPPDPEEDDEDDEDDGNGEVVK